MNIRVASLASAAIAMAFFLCSAAYAIPAMDVQLEDLMAQANDVKKLLNLNPNQQILWQQIESKMRAILGARKRRREQLQSDLKSGLDNSRTELRDLAKKMAAEADLNYQENKQERELWLTIDDALDDAQRQTILRMLAEQLQRVADEGHECKSSEPPRSRGKQKPGGMGGAVPQ